MPAMALKVARHIPYVLYVQDLWPDSVLASGFITGGTIAAGTERALHSACRAAYRGATSIAVIAPGMERVLRARGVPEGKLEVVYNWVDETVFRPADPDPTLARALRSRGTFTLMYAGGVGDLQGLETAVRAVALLGRDSGVHLAIVGEGVALNRLKTLSVDLGTVEQVSFWPAQPLTSMPAILASADAQLISLRNLPLFESTIPSKVQSSLACGQPLVVSAPGDARALAAKSGGAMIANPEDPDSLAEAIHAMKALGAERRGAMGEAGRRYYQQQLSKRVGGARLEAMLAGALGTGAGG
jgi:glycosyltransferase involved in cell wall biosynthesis